MHTYPTCHKKRQFDVSFSYSPCHPGSIKRGSKNYKFYWNKKTLKVVFMFCLECMQKYKWNVKNTYTKKQNLTDACINISLRLETNCFCWWNISLQKKINTRCRKVILSNHNHENADCSSGVSGTF